MYMIEERITSANLVDGKLEVIRRIPSNMVLCNGFSVADTVFKDIYVVEDGKIVLDKTVKGVVTPEKSTPEVIEFPI